MYFVKHAFYTRVMSLTCWTLV